MDELRRAAKAALAELAQTVKAPAEPAEIQRVSFEVGLDADTEIVSIRLKKGAIQAVCSCGQSVCVHLQQALRFAAGDEPRPSPSPRSLTAGPGQRSAVPEPREQEASEPTTFDGAALAEALEELTLAIVRTGIASRSGVSVKDTIERLVRLGPRPAPLGFCRFIGRLETALDARDLDECAKLLGAAGQWADDLRSPKRDELADARRCTWLGAETQQLQRVSNRTLIEVAREVVNGIERGQIERRYLIDRDTGETLREERVRGSDGASIGPCPRMIEVSFGELDPHGTPRRARLLQYTVGIELDRPTWSTIESWAERDFGKVIERYRSDVAQFAGLHEPFAIVAPAAISRDAAPALVDEHGRMIGLSAPDDGGVLRRIEELTEQAPAAFVAGRLLDSRGSLVLRPLALGILDGEQLRHERL